MSGGKRTAEYQINDRMDHPEDDDMDEVRGPVKASAEVLSKRKIIMPKGRKLNGITSKATSQVSDQNNKIKALNNKFIEEINKLNQPNSIANLKPLAQKYIEYYDRIQLGKLDNDNLSSNLSHQVNSSTTTPSNGSSDKPNPFAFLKSTDGKELIPNKPAPFNFGNKPSTNESNKPSSVFSFNTTQTETAPKPSSGFDFGNNASKEFKKPTTFNFGKTEIPSNSSAVMEEPKNSFNFGSKPEESTKPSGFSFSASMEKTATSSESSFQTQTKSTFSFGSSNASLFTSSNSTSTTMKPFSFGNTTNTEKLQNSKSLNNSNDTPQIQEIVDPDSQNETTGTVTDKPVDSSNKEVDESSDESESEAIKIQGPTFDLKSKPTTKNSPFTFGPKPEKKVENSDSDSEPEVEIKGPSFTFNKPIADKVFKFSKNLEAGEDKKKEDDKPTFTFGKSNDNLSASKPAFSFKPPTEAKELDKPVSLKESESKVTPKFDFGNGKSGTNFSFTKSTQDTPNQGFTFGATSSFGNSNNGTDAANQHKTTEKPPAFSFGSDKPAFSFEPSNKSSNFAFGSSNNSAFSFGKTDSKKDESANPFGAVNSEPSKTFSFGSKSTELTGENKPILPFSFNLGSTVTFGENSSKQNSNESKPAVGDDEKMPEEETGGDFKPIVKLTSEKLELPTGEENEEVLYTKRAKLMLFDKNNTEKPYINKGLGDLKVLKNKETNKSRILIRADGGLRVLMNNAITSEISYSSAGDGSLVRVPTVNPNTNEIDTYMLKVKTAQDGAELLKTINNAKN